MVIIQNKQVLEKILEEKFHRNFEWFKYTKIELPVIRHVQTKINQNIVFHVQSQILFGVISEIQRKMLFL